MRAAVRTVFLDAGGVIIEPRWDRVSAVLAGAGLDAPPWRLAPADPYAKHAADRPAFARDGDRARAYFMALLQRIGFPGEAAQAGAERLLGPEGRDADLWDGVPEGTRAALDDLASSGAVLAVVSNSDGTLGRRLRRLRLAQWFTAIVDSAEVGAEKPDPRIFRTALRATAARPETTLHLGDYYHADVVGATAASISGWLLDPAGLHEQRDCPRVSSLAELARAVRARAEREPFSVLRSEETSC